MKSKHPHYSETTQQPTPVTETAAAADEETTTAIQKEGKKEAWKSFECFCSYKSTSKTAAIDHIAAVHKGRRHMKFVNEGGVCRWVSSQPEPNTPVPATDENS